MVWVAPNHGNEENETPLTYTPNPPPQHPQPGPPAPQAFPPAAPNRTRTLWLAIGIPVGVILLLAIVAVAVLVWVGISPADKVDTSATLEDAQSVSINVPNATLNILPSTDDRIHVTMTGSSTGPTPALNTRVDGAVAHVNADCPHLWFTRCDLTLTVALPAKLNVTAHGVNGRITLSDLAGDIRLETTDGSIDATGTSGQLDLVTVNGRITVQDAASGTVTAKTVNGSVELDFNVPPSAVTATSTNGAITVQVPDDGTRYAVSATTVLGKIDTGTVPTDPAAKRAISAETVNGSITVCGVGR